MYRKPFNIDRVAEIELVYKTHIRAQDRPQVDSVHKAYQILRHTWDKNKIELQEQFVLLLLTTHNRLLGRVFLASGSSANVQFDLKHLIAAVSKANASGVVLAHNHPAGDPRASEQDIVMTVNITQILNFIGVDLMDHIILTAYDGYFSFAEHGLL